MDTSEPLPSTALAVPQLPQQPLQPGGLPFHQIMPMHMPITAPMTYEQLIQSGYQTAPGMMWMPVFLPPPHSIPPPPGAVSATPAAALPPPQLLSHPRSCSATPAAALPPEQSAGRVHVAGGGEAMPSVGGGGVPSVPNTQAALKQLSIAPRERGEVSPRKRGKTEEQSPSQVQPSCTPSALGRLPSKSLDCLFTLPDKHSKCDEAPTMALHYHCTENVEFCEFSSQLLHSDIASDVSCLTHD